MNKTVTLPILGTKLRIHGKDTAMLDIESELRGRLIRGSDGPSQVSLFGPRIPKVLNLGRLFKRDYLAELLSDSGAALSYRVVTDAGVAFLTTNWLDGSKLIQNFNAHANGTGTTAEATGQTALVTETGTRATGTKSKPAANQLQSQGTISQTATAAITEHGLFDSTTVAGSTLWDRSVFSAINVNNGDSIQFTYTLTVNSGG